MTRKIYLLVIMNLIISHGLFGQYFDYVSLGYNTVALTSDNAEISTHHYFLNNSQFSKMAFERNYEILMLEQDSELEMGGTVYKGVFISYFLQGGDDFYRKANEGYAYGYTHDIFRVINGRLVYAEMGNYISRGIEYSDTGLTVYLATRDDEIVLNFYNIPETQLYDRFMGLMVETIRGVISSINVGYTRAADYEKEIKKLTKMELAIFRNCLFAAHQYSFQQQFWQDFMNKYFSINYQGTHSSAESLAAFSGSERALLEMIQKYEAE